MFNSFSRLGLAALISLTAMGSAQALVINVSDNIRDNAYINNSTIRGRFDLNPYVATNSEYNAPYEVVSAAFQFSFADDNDRRYRGASTTGYRRIGYNHYTRDVTHHYADDRETAMVNVEGQRAGGGTAYSDQRQYNGTRRYTSQRRRAHRHYYRHYHWWSFSNHYHYSTHYHYERSYYDTRYFNRFYGFSGNFDLEQFLNETVLAALSGDGIIDYVLNVRGDLIFKSANLKVELRPTPTAVPEPASAALFGLGLAGLGLLRRRRKQR